VMDASGQRSRMACRNGACEPQQYVHLASEQNPVLGQNHVIVENDTGAGHSASEESSDLPSQPQPRKESQTDEKQYETFHPGLRLILWTASASRRIEACAASRTLPPTLTGRDASHHGS